MKVYYDLHIHSCLSPCGDDDMTPNNIVNMALLAGLNLIALTDHNSCKNCPALLEVAQKAGLAAVAGMELCTAEECHVVCLFPTLESAMAFDEMVEKTIPPIRNKPDVFGTQIIMDEGDTVTGSYPTLLTTASSIGIDDVPALVRRYGGTAFPAHIDRPSYSVTASLGTVPDAGFCAFEVTRYGDADRLAGEYPAIQGYPLLCNSDAHALSLIQEYGPWLDLDGMNAGALVQALNGNLKSWGR
jgi:PHP family Zn ribbon phosphoesterase